MNLSQDTEVTGDCDGSPPWPRRRALVLTTGCGDADTTEAPPVEPAPYCVNAHQVDLMWVIDGTSAMSVQQALTIDASHALIRPLLDAEVSLSIGVANVEVYGSDEPGFLQAGVQA